MLKWSVLKRVSGLKVLAMVKVQSLCISQLCVSQLYISRLSISEFEVRDLGLTVLAMVRGWLEGSGLCHSWLVAKDREQKAFFGLCL